MVLVSLLVLCAAMPAAEPQSTPAAKPAPASSARHHAKKSKARTVRRPARKPLPPPADIPSVLESASVWRGCLESHDLPKLASSLGMDQPQLTALLDEKGLSPAQNDGCIAYVAATGGEAGAASAIFQSTDANGDPRTVAFHKTGDSIIVTPAVCDCQESAHRVLNLPARDFIAASDSAPDSIPANVLWQLDILVPHMVEGVPSAPPPATESAGPSPSQDPQSATAAVEPLLEPNQLEPNQSAPDRYIVRVGLGHRNADDREELESVEIIDPVSGKRLNGAWWLERPGGPGVIIGMNGVAYERLLWESPVKYSRSARGVGASTTTLRRRVPAKKGSAKATVVRTIKVPSYHLGVDMTAPKGTDVHAVGDATVSFAGRRRGFGNVIILDHGRGYQTYYAHLSKILKGVKAGASVARGDIIGLVGSTGRSTAPHLHFETRKDTHYLDPFDKTHQLDFWLLTADEQERLAMQLLSEAPVIAADDVAPRRQQ